MSVAESATQGTEVVYDLTGTLLEVCTCGVLCPCWVGEDPDNGDCLSVLSYNFSEGTIRGVDVSGRTIANIVHIPGNVLVPGSWRVAQFIDDGATDEQFQALQDAYSGRLGGPLADLAGLVGEVLTVERVPISHQVVDGVGTLDVATSPTARWSRSGAPTGRSRRFATRSSRRFRGRRPTRRRRRSSGSACRSTASSGRRAERHPGRLPDDVREPEVIAGGTGRRLGTTVPVAVAAAWAVALVAQTTGNAALLHAHDHGAGGALPLGSWC